MGVYEGVKALERFYVARWSSGLEFDDFSDFRSIVDEGNKISMQDSLGELLETANYYSGTLESPRLEEIETKGEVKDIYHQRGSQFRREYNLQGLSSLLIEGDAISLGNFVKEWHQSSEGKIWVPNYVKLPNLPKVYVQAKDDKPQTLVGRFGVGIVETLGEKTTQTLAFPFDGFVLAECLRLSYENK